MKIGIACDHHGVKLKEYLVNKLAKDYDIVDYGTNDRGVVDYPDYAFKVGADIANKDIDYGILICGTGIGMSIAANKVNGVRCAKINDKKEAKLAKEHNHANAISFSSKVKAKKALTMIKVFLETENSLETRHVRRVKKIDDYK